MLDFDCPRTTASGKFKHQVNLRAEEGFGAGRAEIREGREHLQRSTKGVRERLDNTKSESISREQKTSEIKKTIESSRAQQRKNGPG